MTLVERYAAGLGQVMRHEIILTHGPDPRPYRSGRALLLACSCSASTRHGGRPRHDVIEARAVFPAAEAIAAWRAWHAQRGVTV